MDKKMKEMGMSQKAHKDVLMSLKKLAQEMIAGDLGDDSEEGPKGIMAELKIKKLKQGVRVGDGSGEMDAMNGMTDMSSDAEAEHNESEVRKDNNHPYMDMSEEDCDDMSDEDLDKHIKMMQDAKRKKQSSV